MTAEEKYMNDPRYHALVTIMLKEIREHQFTPGELREAAVLAATMYEMHHIQPFVIKLPPEESPND